ncbi:MAG: 50S ribosomal protein L24 [Candidatus Sungbacteria bacterium]|nr:50S ribosomal protein L24 [Candidatus Sungbacteria bacterium]
MKLKKGDQVKIISGNDKGKQGTILSILRDEEKIVIEGLNLKKKHMRPRQQGKKGEVILVPAAFTASRVMIVCKKCGKAARIGYRVNDSGAKIRVCKKCGQET